MKVNNHFIKLWNWINDQWNRNNIILPLFTLQVTTLTLRAVVLVSFGVNQQPITISRPIETSCKNFSPGRKA
jgi:hypothetical protein